jgi:hypothetical protein
MLQHLPPCLEAGRSSPYQHFMSPAGSQQRTNSSHPEPDASSPHPGILFQLNFLILSPSFLPLDIPSCFISLHSDFLSSNSHLGFPSGLFSPTRTTQALLFPFMHATGSVSLILADVIAQKHLASSKNREALLSPLILRFSGPHIFLSSLRLRSSPCTVLYITA